jgi:hypothetical protein
LWVICKKNLIFVRIPKNKFLDPQIKNPNKTRRKHFWSFMLSTILWTHLETLTIYIAILILLLLILKSKKHPSKLNCQSLTILVKKSSVKEPYHQIDCIEACSYKEIKNKYNCTFQETLFSIQGYRECVLYYKVLKDEFSARCLSECPLENCFSEKFTFVMWQNRVRNLIVQFFLLHFESWALYPRYPKLIHLLFLITLVVA